MVAIVSTTTDRTFIFPAFADLSFGEVDPIEILMESLFDLVSTLEFHLPSETFRRFRL
jgi:hypothetical protein